MGEAADARRPDRASRLGPVESRPVKRVLKALYAAVPRKQEMFLALRFLPLPPRVYRHLHFRGVFSVEIPGSQKHFRMTHFGYELENELFWRGLYGNYERESMRIWIALCARARSIVDVGANTGVYSLVAKTINPDAVVTAFEPLERIYRKLIDNIRINGLDVSAHAVALSNRTGEGFYFDTLTEHVYSVTVNKNILGPGVPFEKRTLETIALDEFIQRTGLERIDLMKIDVESHEPEVLEGFAGHLDRFHPDMLIEVLDDEVAGRLNGILAGRPYRYYDISEVAGLRRIPEVRKSCERNVLACSDDTARILGLP
jgi:FkbM family methyltransferase